MKFKNLQKLFIVFAIIISLSSTVQNQSGGTCLSEDFSAVTTSNVDITAGLDNYPRFVLVCKDDEREKHL
jgi:hypothetical protein